MDFKKIKQTIQTNKKTILIVAAVSLLLMQVVPYGKNHDNPPVVKEPVWNTAHTRALAKRACFNCHSNESKRPWYAQVAPVSWLVQSDIDEARHHLNFSRWDKPQKHADDASDEIKGGDMPPLPYWLMHPEARLTEAEKTELAESLDKITKKK